MINIFLSTQWKITEKIEDNIIIFYLFNKQGMQ